jgi:hypothetical protein
MKSYGTAENYSTLAIICASYYVLRWILYFILQVHWTPSI